jgi:AbiV family abortive infection protein
MNYLIQRNQTMKSRISLYHITSQDVVLMGKNLIPKEVYREAMVESLKNAKALVQESYLVAKNVSSTHALMLKNLAIEEIGKAIACWNVVAEILPRNHPMIKRSGPKSVFRNHDVKNALYVAFEGSLLLAQWKRESGNGIEETSEGELLGLGLAASALGPFGTKKRFEWMYVDVVRNQDGAWGVSSPLKTDSQQRVISYVGVKGCINYLEWLIGLLGNETIEEYRTQRREWLSKNDSDFPKKPRW